VDTLSYKTVSANRATVTKEWVLVDATDVVLGRLASKVAKILRGKNKPSFTPHVDCGDKIYLSYSGYPGGQRVQTPSELLAKYPERLIEKAVKGMLPKNRLGSKIYGNLKVYVGSTHKQEAQNPQLIDLNTIK